jgi:hypothetical protein
MRILAVLNILCAAALAATAARADETVSVGGADAVLLRPAKPRASIILMTGGDGTLGIGQGGEISRGSGNQLVRTRHDYLARGFAVLVPNLGVDLAAAVTYMAAIKRPVTLVGTSRGTQRAAQGVACGARPDKLVLTSGLLSNESGASDNVESILGSPDSMPRTLVVHHRQDGCSKTQPAGVDPFIKWAGGRARAVWLNGGVSEGDPCEARAYHGFNGIDGQVVSVVSSFAGH